MVGLESGIRRGSACPPLSVSCAALVALACQGASPSPRHAGDRVADPALSDLPVDAAPRVVTAGHSGDTATGQPLLLDAASDAEQGEVRLRLLAVGDVLFGRYDRSKRYLRVARSDRSPFAAVAHLIGSADIAFANLECPMLAEPARFQTTRRLTFRAEPADAQTLARAGFDVVSIANNHAHDFGRAAVVKSRRHLEKAGIAAIGGGAGIEEALRPALLERGGLRVAVLAFTVWLKGKKTPSQNSAVAYVRYRDVVDTISPVIRRLHGQGLADAIVVSLHWGWEKETSPRHSQRRVARALIDAGAHVVLGHHPHVIQQIEVYRHGVIAYSLGNFLFDNPYPVQRLTVALEVVIERNHGGVRANEVVVHPVVIDRKTRTPRHLLPDEHRSWRRQLERLAPGAAVAGAAEHKR